MGKKALKSHFQHVSINIPPKIDPMHSTPHINIYVDEGDGGSGGRRATHAILCCCSLHSVCVCSAPLCSIQTTENEFINRESAQRITSRHVFVYRKNEWDARLREHDRTRARTCCLSIRTTQTTQFHWKESAVNPSVYIHMLCCVYTMDGWIERYTQRQCENNASEWACACACGCGCVCVFEMDKWIGLRSLLSWFWAK